MWKVSWKALFSIKSLLKLIELILALLVFALTGTFDTETTVSCRSFNQDSDQENYTVVYKTDFPFDFLDARCDGTESDLKRLEFNRDYGAMAQSFLAWGVITVIYCIMAVFAYVMLNESQEWKYYEKTATIVSLADFGGTMLWSILWLIVSVVWTVGSVQLENFIEDSSICPSNDTLYSKDDADFLQTDIAVGFGYASVLMWTTSIWWMLKSTSILQPFAYGKNRGGYEPIQ